MKKPWFLWLLLLCLLAAGCASPAIPENGVSGNPLGGRGAAQSPEVKAIDVDLTALSSTMVYGEVYNIMMAPEHYLGQTIKGSGLYNCVYSERYGRHFHYFIVSDATGCCPQGLDFVWKGEHTYPGDYPELGETIEVTGVFTKGEVEGQLYYHLVVEEITVVP